MGSTSHLPALDVFVRIVAEGSFSSAARSLGLTPSAVSKQLSRLEDHLGVRLFNRTTRKLGLTEEGAAFHERAAHILAELAEAEAAVSALHTEPKGTLRLNLPSAFGARHVAPHLPDYFSRYPQVRIEMSLNDRFVDMIEEGFDLTIRVGDLPDSSLIARRLAGNRRVICAAPSYFASHPAPRVPSDLSGHNCLVYTYRRPRNDWPFRGPDGREETIEVSGNLETDNSESLLLVARGGLGVALLPLWMAGEDLAAGRLLEALQDYQTPDHPIHAIYPPGRHLSAKVRSFVDFLAERYRTQSGWTREDSVAS